MTPKQLSTLKFYAAATPGKGMLLRGADRRTVSSLISRGLMMTLGCRLIEVAIVTKKGREALADAIR